MPDIKIIKANSKLNERGKEKHSKLRVAAYCRVSTDDEEQISSYNSQMQYYNEFINKNPEWKMVGIYADKAITGTSTEKRVDFMRMINDCLNGDIDMVITKSISRFARNTVDTLHYVRILKEKGVAIFFEEEHINTLSMDGELMLTVLSSVAQQEVHNTSAHVKKGLKMRMQRGELVGFQGCLGFDYHKEDKSMSVNQEEAKIVKRIYARYLEGAGCKVIARELTEDKIKTKSGKTHWCEAVVRTVLRNEKYAGDVLLGKSFTVDPLTKKRLKNLGEVDKFYIENHHEAIVSKEDFLKVQAILDSRACPKRVIDGKRQHKLGGMYTFSSKIKCGLCGDSYSRRTVHRKKRDKIIWQCMEFSKRGRRGCENSKAVPNEVLESGFLTAYNLLCGDLKSSFKAVYDEIEKEFDLDKISKEIEKKESDLEKLKSKKAKLIDLKLADSMDDSTYKESFDEICKKIDKTKNDIETLKENNTKIKDKKLNLEKAKTILENGGPLEHFDKFIFDSICEKIIVGDKEDPFKLKYILKTKDVFKLSTADYFLKLCNPTKLDQMKPVDNDELLEEIERVESETSGCSNTINNTEPRLIKILEFDHFFKHCVFVKGEDGYLQKKTLRAVPVSVYYYMK